MDNLSDEIVDKAARLIAKSKYCTALTGAGISTESGIPDFRGPQGLWSRVDPKVATHSYFIDNPKDFWSFHLKFMEFRNVKPNDAHIALSKLEKLSVLKYVITQNIDGLHQQAGLKNVIELHGNLKTASCIYCGRKYSYEEVLEIIGREGLPPRCPVCRGILKPDVVLFEEPLPYDAIATAYYESSRSDLMLVLGTSLAVYPAASLPETVKSHGGKLIIINLESTQKDYLGDIVIHGKLGIIVPMIVRRVEEYIR